MCLDLNHSADSYDDKIIFYSSYNPPDWYTNKNCPKKFPIFPKYHELDYTLLGVFLNELNGFQKSIKSTYTYLVFFKEINLKDTKIKWKVYATIFPDITVIASHNWLKVKWTLNRNYVLSDKGKGLKLRAKSDVQYEKYYCLAMRELKDGTKALLSHLPIVFFCPYDFSDAYHYYVKK